MRRLLRLPEVEDVAGLKRSNIYLRIKEGNFPMPVILGARAVAWKSEKFLEWVENRPRVNI